MKADQIIKNARIFTSNQDAPQATALAVKDGKFVYVGDETGLSAYEGEVTDLGGRFIVPGIIDSHVHVTMPVGFEYADMGPRIECDGKQAALDVMADYIRKHPGEKRYRFMMEKKVLNGDDIIKEELDYVGKELAENSYPIKSFFDAGACAVFHSDYPVSPSFSIPHSIYMAETRALPKSFGIEAETQHNIKEAITREQSLRALTINVAHAWHQEHRLGSIEFGKIANMTVYDCDFLHDDIEKVAGAKLVATVVDGEEVYKA